MRDRSRRCAAVAGCVLLVAVLQACGTNKGPVCDDAAKAVGDYNSRLKTVSPDDIRQWRTASAQLAGRLAALAKRADDAGLRRTLNQMAAQWRQVSEHLAAGDISRLETAVQRQPGQLARACR